MTVSLVPMDAAGFKRFMERVVADFAEHQRGTGLAAEVALDRAVEETARLLPAGQETPGHAFFAALDGDDDVGALWLAFAPDDRQVTGAWVYYVLVYDEHRGRGRGRDLMGAAEEECRRRGVASLGLNVHGHNTVARGLYESLGYRVMAQQMRKEIN